MLAGLFLALLAGIGFDALMRGAEAPYARNVGHRPGRDTAGSVRRVPSERGLRSTCRQLVAQNRLRFPALAHSSGLRQRGRGPAIPLAHRISRVEQFVAGRGYADSHFAVVLHRRERKVVWLIFGLALLEVTVFAHRFLDTFPLSRTIDLELRAFLRQHPGDYRIFNSSGPNASMSLPAQDVWGFDPGIPLRYTELLEFARAMDPAVWARLRLSHSERLLSMFRLRYAFYCRAGPALHPRRP